jgi:prophage DNA circulation protein
MTTNWPAQLRRASFRGARFWVEEYAGGGTGRHGVNHDYVGGAQGQAEDLGFRTGKHRVTAYIASDAAYAEADALVAACSAEGPAALILPTGGVIKCLCLELERKEQRDKLGYVAFELEFLPWGGSLGPFATELFDRVCASALTLFASAVSGAMSVLAGVTSAQISVASSVAANSVAVLQTALAAAPIDATTAASTQAALGALAGSAALFAGPDDAGAWLQAAATQIQTIGAALDPTAGAAFAASLAQNLGALAPSSASPGLAAQGALANALLAGLQGAAAGEAARAASTLPLTDRVSARQALDALTALTDPLADAVGQTLGPDAAQPLADALLAAARQLAAAALDTAPLIEVDTTLSYPASAMAFALYGDPSRADEILARNEIGTPLFLPGQFEALAQ